MEDEFIRDMARWIAMTVHERMEKEGELNEQKRERVKGRKYQSENYKR